MIKLYCSLAFSNVHPLVVLFVVSVSTTALRFYCHAANAHAGYNEHCHTHTYTIRTLGKLLDNCIC